MILKARGRETMTRADALTLWAAARERAVDELSSKAAQVSREGQESEAARLRVAARILRLRAIQERAQAAGCAADSIIHAHEVGG